jgi:hypothetical protein
LIFIRRCVMVSLPYDGEIYILNGDNIVGFQKQYVLINIYMGIMYTCMSTIYICIADTWRFRNNRFWHNFSFVFMTLSFSILRKNSTEFFLQFSSIYLSISKLLQFSLKFFNLLQFTSCSNFLSPIFSVFSHFALMLDV